MNECHWCKEPVVPGYIDYPYCCMSCKAKGENTSTTLSASEALFGFCGWLTSRDEKTVMSASDDAGQAVNLIVEFCERNNLEDPVMGWEKNLTHPS